MAAKNKYASVNFNHLYDKTTTTSSTTNPAKISSSSSSSSSSASYSAISSPNKPHGRMLVLTRPNPKPVTPSPPSASIQSQQFQHQQPNLTQQISDQPQPHLGSDSSEISLRPLGRTGIGSPISSPVLNCENNIVDVQSILLSPKPGKFVPPHLRPGFVPKEEKIGHDLVRSKQQGPNGLPGEDDRPKSGGYERMRRPISSGSRPGSSG